MFPETDVRSYVVGNFVSTLDGVVSYAIPGLLGGGPVSGHSIEDAFVMGLLRAHADAVLFGAGTLHGDWGHVRTAAFVFPEAERDYAELRRSLGKRSLHPLNVVVSGSGRVDLAEPTFHTPGLEALVVTSGEGRARLEAEHGGAPKGTQIVVVGDHPPLAPEAISALLYADFGVRLLLHEGGPTLFGSFLAAAVVDELFLTLAPSVAGRTKEGPRPGLAQGVGFHPESAPGFELVSVKSAGEHLLLRYGRSARS